MTSPQFSAYQRAQARWHADGMGTDILDGFAAYQRSTGLADTTVRNRNSILHTLARNAGRPLQELNIDELRAHIGRQGIQPGSRRTERGAIVAFYTYAHNEGLIDENPAQRLKPIKAPKGQPRPFAAEQIDAMLTTGAYRKTRAMILLGYYQGFRVSSIARVHGHDIDLLSNTIHTVGKGGKEAALPLHPVIAELSKTMPQDDWWFPARGGRTGHIKAASVTDRITRAKKRAEIRERKLTPHSLRHAFASDLVEDGVDIQVVQELMMHESVATTQIYSRVSERRKRDGILHLNSREIPTHSGRVAA